MAALRDHLLLDAGPLLGARGGPRRGLVRHRRAADAARVAGMAYGPLPGRPRRDARRARVADRRDRGRALQRPHGPAHAPHGRRRPAPSPGTAGASAPSRASLRSAPRRRPSDRALTSRARGPPPAPAPARAGGAPPRRPPIRDRPRALRPLPRRPSA